MTSIPPAWCVNPENDKEWRWWDGNQWTDLVSPIETETELKNIVPEATVHSESATEAELAISTKEIKATQKNPKKVIPRTYEGLEFSIVGEASYQKDLNKILKKYGDGNRAKVGAYLIPEPNNRYDKNAVVVKIYDKVVGYLSGNDAKIFHDEFKPYCAARAEVVAGSDKSGGNIFVMITLVSSENGPLTPEAREYFRL